MKKTTWCQRSTLHEISTMLPTRYHFPLKSSKFCCFYIDLLTILLVIIIRYVGQLKANGYMGFKSYIQGYWKLNTFLSRSVCSILQISAVTCYMNLCFTYLLTYITNAFTVQTKTKNKCYLLSSIPANMTMSFPQGFNLWQTVQPSACKTTSAMEYTTADT